MKQPLNNQLGMTFIGIVFTLGMVALVVIFVLRLFPLYNEKMQIESAMQTVVSQPDAEKKNVADTRRAFMRALAVTNISRFTTKNIKDHVNIVKPKSSSEPPMLHIQYQATNKLFADIQLLMVFDKQLPLDNSASK